MTKTIKIDWAPLWKRALMRFARVFVFSGLATLGTLLATAPTVTTLEDLKIWGLSLLVAFVSGGLAGIEKGYRG